MWRGRCARRLLATAALAFALAACSDGATEPLAPCTSPVQLSASSGTQPTLSWTPRCGAGRLLVDALPPSQGFGWRWVVTAGERPIPPGLRYGVLPEGTTEDRPVTALEVGRPYGVLLFAPNGATIATAEFMP